MSSMRVRVIAALVMLAGLGVFSSSMILEENSPHVGMVLVVGGLIACAGLVLLMDGGVPLQCSTVQALAICMMLIGGMMAFFGWEERAWYTSMGESPQEISVAELTANGFGENRRVRLREYEWLEPPVEAEPPAYRYRFNLAYRILGRRPARRDDIEYVWVALRPVPADGRPTDSRAIVLVRGPDFWMVSKMKNRKKLPDDIAQSVPPLEGTVMNGMEALDPEDRKRLARTFPHADFDRVVVVDDLIRRPSGTLVHGLLFGGLGLFAVGGIMLVLTLRRQLTRIQPPTAA